MHECTYVMQRKVLHEDLIVRYCHGVGTVAATRPRSGSPTSLCSTEPWGRFCSLSSTECEHHVGHMRVSQENAAVVVVVVVVAAVKTSLELAQ